jgi:hypothetical protein
LLRLSLLPAAPRSPASLLLLPASLLLLPATLLLLPTTATVRATESTSSSPIPESSMVPSVFGCHLECKSVRGVDTREECH